MKVIQDFIKNDSTPGVVLIIATVLALLLSNSPWASYYASFLHIPIEVRIGELAIDKHLYHWVNDGLMAVFFFLVGLEIKREVLEGHLASLSQIILPGVAAIGGMAVPALIYVAFNQGDATAMRGWAIPTATDIAFALGVLSILGNRVPASLKVFLLALAIIDDLGAVIIIALFYTAELSTLAISIASICLCILILLNRLGVARKAAYVVVGVILWASVLKSGVHATLAGVVLAFTIPLNSVDEEGEPVSLLKSMEHALHYWVSFFILPIFAFVNSGIDIRGISSMSAMMGSVPMGIAAGLFFGKQIGVMLFSWLAIKLRLASLPQDCNWIQLYGASILTGIGFTMSLFIGSLAFTQGNLYEYTDKLAILMASFAAGVVGYLVLFKASKS